MKKKSFSNIVIKINYSYSISWIFNELARKCENMKINYCFLFLYMAKLYYNTDIEIQLQRRKTIFKISGNKEKITIDCLK